MALIVEDGTGLSTAESLCAVATADTFHSNRGATAWAALTTAAKEQALRKAADYVEGVYRELWAGYRINTTQALSWPRDEMPIKDSSAMNYGGRSYYANNAVPAIVANACAILALKSATQTLAPDVVRQTKSETVGEISVTYMDGASPFVRFREVDLMLSPFMRGSANSISVVRA